MSDDASIPQKFVELLTQDLYESTKALSKRIQSEVHVTIRRTFARYTKNMEKSIRSCKTILYRYTPKDLYSFYVPLDVDIDKNTRLEVTSLITLLESGHRILLTGTGGSGKSLLLRHLYLSSTTYLYAIPLFVELRYFNDSPNTFYQFVAKTVADCGVKLSEDEVQLGLFRAKFALLLDGLDELTEKKRADVIAALHFLKSCPHTICIITSRPDTTLMQLQDFLEFRVAPLTREKSIDVIQRLDFDCDVKRDLCNDLKGSTFDDYKPLLSNPLLLNLMLIKYSDSGRGSNYRSDYFAEVFEAMWSRHDATKGLHRQRFTSLERSSFLRVLQNVAASTYRSRKFTFSRQFLLDAIEEARSQQGAVCDPERFTSDLIVSVSLIIEEGLDYMFIHRSFQEYLCARFLLESSEIARNAVMRAFYEHANVDTIFDLANEINPVRLKQDILLPDLRRTLRPVVLDTNGRAGVEDVLSIITEWTECVQCTSDGIVWKYKDVRPNIVKLVNRLFASEYRAQADKAQENWDEFRPHDLTQYSGRNSVYYASDLQYDQSKTMTLAHASADAVLPQEVEFARLFLDIILNELEQVPLKQQWPYTL